MTKKIEDYLHLYLGCEITWFDKNLSSLQYSGKLVGAMGRGPMGYEFCIYETTGDIKYPKTTFHEIKPILRPLSSMTRGEAISIAALAIGDSDWMDISYGTGKNQYNIHESIYCLRIDKFCKHPEINDWLPGYLLQIDPEDCSIILGQFSKQGKELRDTVHDNQHLITKQLLDWHIDLFGLIEAGLAIDSTLNPKDNG